MGSYLVVHLVARVEFYTGRHRFVPILSFARDINFLVGWTDGGVHVTRATHAQAVGETKTGGKLREPRTLQVDLL